MLYIYWTPASISYLTLLILGTVITGFFLSLAYRLRLLKQRDAQIGWLIGFFAAATGFFLSFLLSISLAPGLSFYGLAPVTVFTALCMVSLVQFAYRFPSLAPELKNEAKLALGLSSLYALYEIVFVVYRFAQLFQKHLVFRPDWADLPLAIGLLWVPVVLLRQIVRLSKGDPHQPWWRKLWQPQGHAARSARTFLLLFLILPVLAINEVLLLYLFPVVPLRNTILSIGALTELFAFALVYINYFPEKVSFVAKLVGFTLFTTLAAFGALGWFIGSMYLDIYPNTGIIADIQTLHFAPNEQGGYDISSIPFHFDPNTGENLNLENSQSTRISLPFAFPFYGQTWQQAYVSDDGIVTLEPPTGPLDARYYYGTQPAILALYTDLNPRPDITSSGVYARQDTNQTIITWYRLPGQAEPQNLYTVQLVLYDTGAFDITYNGIPPLNLQDTYQAGLTVSAAWVVGAVPGVSSMMPDQIGMAAVLPYRAGPSGIVHDPYLALRQYLHRPMQPLVYFVIAYSLLILLGLPIVLKRNLVQPLNALLQGVQQMNAGRYDVNVAVQYQDEVGFLTRSFNTMAAELHTLIHNLETRVSERTQELAKATTLAEERSQAAEAASRAKSVFLANMSHELRTPLNAVLGFSELMTRDETLNPSQLENLQIINRSGEHLLALINNILELSKIEAGRVEIQTQPFDLHRLLQGLEEMFRLRAQQRGMALKVERAPDVPQNVCADQGKLRQVLINLLGNAIKFTEAGSITLSVAVANNDLAAGNPAASTGLASDGQILHFAVQDTGVGINAEELELIFEPFSQAQSGKLQQQGAGLGLAISRQYVELWGSQLTVSSTPGVGSTFRFDLPVTLVAALDESALPPLVLSLEPGQHAADGGPFRLLIAEDIFANRLLLIKLLQPLGFEVRGAANGQEALDIWRQWQPHLIFMDMRMPVLDGYEAIRCIKAAPNDHPTILIALTASAFDEEQDALIALGCDDFIRKPFRQRQIFRVLQKYLGVRFIYRAPTSEPLSAPEAAIAAVQAANLPETWRKRMHQATIDGDIAAIENLIKGISAESAELAETLHQLVYQFDYTGIRTLIDILETDVSNIHPARNPSDDKTTPD